MNADKLREIQEALTREFTDPTTSPCVPERVLLVYAHKTDLVDARALVALSYPDFETRVDAWSWPTTTRYEACGVIKHNEPYRDFIRARFLWKERADVKLTSLPSNAQTPDPTAADGGTLIKLTSGTSLAASNACTSVNIELPAAEAVPAGYPTVRRVCLSIAGQAGNHGEVNTPAAPGTNSVTLEYPASAGDTNLHLVAEVPWFKFELPQGTPLLDDPWTYKINYDVTPASMFRQRIYEASSGTDIGMISRYARVHFGFLQSGNESKAAVRGAHAGSLSPSRRAVLAAVLNVEGGPSTVTSVDGPKASWGMNQWTWPRGAAAGEIHQILCYVFDFFPDAWERCFGRYGITMSFASRNRRWSPSTYNDPVLARVPCCRPSGQNPSIRTGLNSIGRALARDTNHGTIATTYAITDRSDTTTIAFMYILYRAGMDTDVQTAQMQWTSYRITYGMRNTRNPTNDQALEGFLTSLGSNMPAADRSANAARGIAEGEAEGHTYPRMNEAFDDTGTTEEWRDWAVRCDNAGKETTPAGTAAAPTVVPRPRARPQARP